VTNNENEMLEQFQAWFEKEFGFGKKEILLTDDERGKALLGAAWLAWQASRQALVIQLPDRASEAYREEFEDVEGGSFNEAAYIRDVRTSIESQGVKCK
jgi:hypothetical protein